MPCKECGSERLASDDGWTYCRDCGRVLDMEDYEDHEFVGEF